MGCKMGQEGLHYVKNYHIIVLGRLQGRIENRIIVGKVTHHGFDVMEHKAE